jgi:hypothetical protein
MRLYYRATAERPVVPAIDAPPEDLYGRIHGIEDILEIIYTGIGPAPLPLNFYAGSV